MTISKNEEEVVIPNFTLESGFTFKEVELVYERAGNKEGPVILVCHALTGNHKTVGTDEDPGWWRGLIHEGGYVDLNHYQVITFNVLGGCDGSTGPKSIDPQTDEPFGATFPNVTVRDLVEVQFLALKKLGVNHLRAVIGGSLGGMQVLEWGFMYPGFVDAMIPIAVTPQFSDYAIAFNHISAKAIKQDPSWQQGEVPKEGLGLAREIGMITYRSAPLFYERFNRKKTNDEYEVQSYLDYQADKIIERFDANSYLTLLNAMNNHDVARGRGGYEAALEQLEVSVVALGFQHDLLYAPQEIKSFVDDVNMLGGSANYYEVETIFGHDGFLVEFDKWGHVIETALRKLTFKINK
ncbi:homoserine O-acetyltransferase MetX [Alkalibacillus haloalkaliphilus]|uniref:homoserine O-acetyltransferase MetX n=1 Tax=Alkalibacillus haloalkaliphilus TaxID=94136 RepID=UPI0029355CAA|nr:homoserine O-acetyltransferase [Alkalibacillus haloalkaliphilus]MDV2581939.1 homoserine O-acetyltransferase [Alkalibacillus haloalkaliphilus]